MNYIKPDIATVCIGMAASMGAMILATGTKKKRHMLPNAEVMIHQPWIQSIGGQVTDIDISAKQMLRQRDMLNKILADATGQTLKKIQADVERDYHMNADEAKKYGIIDHIHSPKKKN